MGGEASGIPETHLELCFRGRRDEALFFMQQFGLVVGTIVGVREDHVLFQEAVL